jgi:hypothetical protein
VFARFATQCALEAALENCARHRHDAEGVVRPDLLARLFPDVAQRLPMQTAGGGVAMIEPEGNDERSQKCAAGNLDVIQQC